MMEKYSKTIEECRRHLENLLAQEQQGSVVEQRIDVEMRLMLAHYDALEQQKNHLLEQKSTSEHASLLKDILTAEQIMRTRLEFAGELLNVDRLVIAACLSTIALHHTEHGESAFERAYPLLHGYFLGENTLPFPELGFLTKKEVLQLLDIEQEEGA